MDNGRVLMGDNCTNSDGALFGFFREIRASFVPSVSLLVAHSLVRSPLDQRTRRYCRIVRRANNSDECYGSEVFHGYLLRHGKYTPFDFPGLSAQARLQLTTTAQSSALTSIKTVGPMASRLCRGTGKKESNKSPTQAAPQRKDSYETPGK